jgi:hypothetical protein
MRILVGCEESQVVCIELRKLGHEAYSCDLQEPSGGHPEWHFQMDVFEAVKLKNWDALICFPDCTYLTVTANKWYKDQSPRKSGTLVGPERREAREKAIKFAVDLFNCGIPLVAMENPIGVLSTRFRKPDQVIQPYYFGHPERKSTCLWLKGLPKLIPTNIVEPVSYIAGGKKYSPTHYNSKRSLNRLDSLPPGPERSKLRSKTYSGIAKAMAEQWFNLKQTEQ